jgi:hypothetical protein
VLPLVLLLLVMSMCVCVCVCVCVQHTDYHQQLGFTGAILMLTRPIAVQLLMHPAMQPGLDAGAYFIILWVSC